MSWQPIETAPTSGVVLIAVECGNEQRTFAAEASFDEAGQHWVVTTGWVGWSRLISAWDVTHWMPLPEPPRLPVDEEGEG